MMLIEVYSEKDKNYLLDKGYKLVSFMVENNKAIFSCKNIKYDDLKDVNYKVVKKLYY